MGDFELANPTKLERAKEKLGKSAMDADLLAEYDKYGGAIKKDGRIIETGSFFDFQTKLPRKEPKIEFGDEYVLIRKKVKKGEEVEGEVVAPERPVLAGPAPKKGRPKKEK